MDAGARVALAELAPSVVRFTRSLIGHVQMRSLQPLAALLLRGQAAFEGAADDRGTLGRKGGRAGPYGLLDLGHQTGGVGGRLSTSPGNSPFPSRSCVRPSSSVRPRGPMGSELPTPTMRASSIPVLALVALGPLVDVHRDDAHGGALPAPLVGIAHQEAVGEVLSVRVLGGGDRGNSGSAHGHSDRDGPPIAGNCETEHAIGRLESTGGAGLLLLLLTLVLTTGSLAQDVLGGEGLRFASCGPGFERDSNICRSAGRSTTAARKQLARPTKATSPMEFNPG